MWFFLWQCFALSVFSSTVESDFQQRSYDSQFVEGQGGFSQLLGRSKTSSSRPSSQFQSRSAQLVAQAHGSSDLVEDQGHSGMVMQPAQNKVSAFQPWQHSIVPIIIHSLHRFIHVAALLYVLHSVLHNCQLLMASQQHPC